MPTSSGLLKKPQGWFKWSYKVQQADKGAPTTEGQPAASDSGRGRQTGGSKAAAAAHTAAALGTNALNDGKLAHVGSNPSGEVPGYSEKLYGASRPQSDVQRGTKGSGGNAQTLSSKPGSHAHTQYPGWNANLQAEALSYKLATESSLEPECPIPDGFYYCYGDFPEVADKGQVPTLAQLKSIHRIFQDDLREVVIIDQNRDKRLNQFVVSCLDALFDTASAKKRYETAQELAKLVAHHMGGAGSEEALQHRWAKCSAMAKAKNGSVCVWLGQVLVGSSRHRALLFKLVAEQLQIPGYCQLLEGTAFCGAEGLMDVKVFTERGGMFVDLMVEPGRMLSDTEFLATRHCRMEAKRQGSALAVPATVAPVAPPMAAGGSLQPVRGRVGGGGGGGGGVGAPGRAAVEGEWRREVQQGATAAAWAAEGVDLPQALSVAADSLQDLKHLREQKLRREAAPQPAPVGGGNGLMQAQHTRSGSDPQVELPDARSAASGGLHSQPQTSSSGHSNSAEPDGGEGGRPPSGLAGDAEGAGGGSLGEGRAGEPLLQDLASPFAPAAAAALPLLEKPLSVFDSQDAEQPGSGSAASGRLRPQWARSGSGPEAAGGALLDSGQAPSVGFGSVCSVEARRRSGPMMERPLSAFDTPASPVMDQPASAFDAPAPAAPPLPPPPRADAQSSGGSSAATAGGGDRMDTARAAVPTMQQSPSAFDSAPAGPALASLPMPLQLSPPPPWLEPGAAGASDRHRHGAGLTARVVAPADASAAARPPAAWMAAPLSPPSPGMGASEVARMRGSMTPAAAPRRPETKPAAEVRWMPPSAAAAAAAEAAAAETGFLTSPVPAAVRTGGLEAALPSDRRPWAVPDSPATAAAAAAAAASGGGGGGGSSMQPPRSIMAPRLTAAPAQAPAPLPTAFDVAPGPGRSGGRGFAEAPAGMDSASDVFVSCSSQELMSAAATNSPLSRPGVRSTLRSSGKSMAAAVAAAAAQELPSGLDMRGALPMGELDAAGAAGAAASGGRPRMPPMDDDLQQWQIPKEDLVEMEVIGRGSFGEVKRGDWHGTGVAVKTLFPTEVTARMISEFHQEVRIMSRLRHPNVALFMGCCISVPSIKGQPHELKIVTEFYKKGSLYHVLHRSGARMPLALRLRLARDIANGMTYLHARTPPVVHRDLKSHNVLIDEKWNAKIADFGLSKTKKSSMSSANSRMGTIEWAAPEVLRGERGVPAEKADVYSYGVVLWELVTRTMPWSHLEQHFAVYAAVVQRNERLRIPGEVEETHPALADIMRRCFADAASRPTMQEVREMLSAALAGMQQLLEGE